MSEIDDFDRYLRTGDPAGLEPAPSAPLAHIVIRRTPGEYRALAAKYRHQASVLLSSADEFDRRADAAEEIQGK